MGNKERSHYLFTNKDLFRLLIPLIIEQFLAMAVGMADTIMVASVGESAVSAVSLVDSIIILLINIFAALATGGAVVAGQYIGQRQYHKARTAGEQLLVFSAIFSVGLMALMYIGKGFILNVVFGSIEPDVYAHANTYLLITFASIPFIAIYNSGAALFRTMSNSRITMITSIIMNFINVFGNAFLIYVVKMGVKGVAIPTLVSRMVAATMIVVLLRNEELIIHIRKKFKFKLDKDMVKNILNIGIPNGIENSMFQLGKIMLLSVIAGFGTASITANAVANSVAGFQILPGIAVGLGLITVVSQCVGSNDYEQVRYYTKKLLAIAYLAIIVINIAIIVLTPYIIRAYNLSPETGALATKIFTIHGVSSCFIWPLSFTLPNTLRASNDVRFTMTVGVSSMWIVRIGFGIILSKYFNFGVFGVWSAMILDWLVRTIFFLIRYRGNKWELKEKLS